MRRGDRRVGYAHFQITRLFEKFWKKRYFWCIPIKIIDHYTFMVNLKNLFLHPKCENIDCMSQLIQLHTECCLWKKLIEWKFARMHWAKFNILSKHLHPQQISISDVLCTERLQTSLNYMQPHDFERLHLVLKDACVQTVLKLKNYKVW